MICETFLYFYIHFIYHQIVSLKFGKNYKGICIPGKYGVGKCLTREMFDKGKCLPGKCGVGKCLTREMWGGEMFDWGNV